MPIIYTTGEQDREFIKMLGENISVDASYVLDWVADNFAPEEIFDEETLRQWALDSGFVEE